MEANKCPICDYNKLSRGSDTCGSPECEEAAVYLDKAKKTKPGEDCRAPTVLARKKVAIARAAARGQVPVEVGDMKTTSKGARIRRIRMVLLNESQFDRKVHLVDDGDPRGLWRKEDMTRPNKLTKKHKRVGVVAEAVIETLGRINVIQSTGTWNVWVTGPNDPYAKDVFKQEKQELLEKLGTK